MVQKLKNIIHRGEALVAKNFYRNPSGKMVVVGITGTDGKTTTASLLYSILKNSGKKTALITTLGASIGDKFYETGFHTTTPSPFSLHRYIKEAQQEGCEYLVLEVTSHALDQNRVAGIHFDLGVITNITHEHLDYHKTYENYMRTKAKLLQMSKICILNADDVSYKFLNSVLPDKKILTYSTKLSDADLSLTKFPIKTNLVGEFNLQNCLAAGLASIVLGVDKNIVKKSIGNFTAPNGRQEIIFDKDFKVIVDFAHTPNALENILQELSKTKKNRIIHVFGAAGQRDMSKRPLMGQASSKYSDVIILTSEDPRKESVEKINSQIESGFVNNFSLHNEGEDSKNSLIYFKIPDRQKALEFAVSIARDKDIVIATGKGHEKSMNYGKGEIPWDEKEILLDALKKRRVL